jgi:hypothetical protein
VGAEPLISLSLPAGQSSCTFPFFLSFFLFLMNTAAQTQKGEGGEKDCGFYKWRDAILVKSNHIIPTNAHTPVPATASPTAAPRATRTTPLPSSGAAAAGGRQPSAPRATSLCSGGPWARRPLLLTKSFASLVAMGLVGWVPLLL